MSAPRSNRSYHHGDLRSALLAATERLMAREAGWSFTLREVAREAGVSHNAPYNHFPDRRALLAAVAARGFEDLTAALRSALQPLESADVIGGIRATGSAYVVFATANPARFRLMFSGELSDCKDPAFLSKGEAAFAVLRSLIEQGVEAGQIRPDPGGTHALTAWSLVHGLASLALDGKVAIGSDERAVESVANAVSRTLIEGLAAGSTDRCL